MFVQYSFVQPRREPPLLLEPLPLAVTPSLTVAAGLACMIFATWIALAAG